MLVKFGENTLNGSARARWVPTRCRTIEGQLSIHELGKACREGDKGAYESVAFDDGKWKFLLHTSDCSDADTGELGYLGIYLTASGEGSHPQAVNSVHDFDVQLLVGDTTISTFNCERKLFTLDGDGWGTKTFCRMNKLAEHPDLNAKDTVTLYYIIREYPTDSNDAPLKMIPPVQSLTSAYAQLFDDPITADVCFVIHHPSASEKEPRRIYAHSKILAARAEYFATLFQNTDLDENTSNYRHVPHEWSSGADSDYDDVDEDKDAASEGDLPAEDDTYDDLDGDNSTAYFRGRNNLASASSKSVSNEANTPILHAPGEESPRAKSVDEGVACTPGGSRRASAIELALPSSLLGRQRKIIHVHDAAYRTYYALLFYLYTGSIRFAPPTSTYRAERDCAHVPDSSVRLMTRDEFNQRHSTTISTLNDDVALYWTSAKSMYKLCDRLDIPNLLDAAAEHIRVSLTPDTVAQEVSSAFSAKYPDIRAVQAEYLEDHYDEVCTSEGFERLFLRMFGDAGVADVWLNLFAKLTVREETAF